MPHKIPTRHGVVQPAFNLDGAKSAAGAKVREQLELAKAQALLAAEQSPWKPANRRPWLEAKEGVLRMMQRRANLTAQGASTAPTSTAPDDHGDGFKANLFEDALRLTLKQLPATRSLNYDVALLAGEEATEPELEGLPFGHKDNPKDALQAEIDELRAAELLDARAARV